MTCSKAQNLITPFINNKLNIKEMEEFLEHIGSCPNCREELEFYYALLTAMKQLDEDKNLSDDFRLELSGKLKKAQDKIVHAKYTYYRKMTVLFLIMILLAFLLGISYADKSKENGKNVARSDFQISGTFQDGRYVYIDQQLQNYFKQQAVDRMPQSSGEINNTGY